MHEDDFTLPSYFNRHRAFATDFNAFFLHRELSGMAMSRHGMRRGPVDLASRGFLQGPAEVLVSWALRSGFEHIEDDRAHLAAVMLAWFLSTSRPGGQGQSYQGLGVPARWPPSTRGVPDRAIRWSRRPVCAASVCWPPVTVPFSREEDTTTALRCWQRRFHNCIFADGEPFLNALLQRPCARYSGIHRSPGPAASRRSISR